MAVFCIKRNFANVIKLCKSRQETTLYQPRPIPPAVRLHAKKALRTMAIVP